MSNQSNSSSSSSLIKTILNLTGCVIGVAGSVCYEVTSYWGRVSVSDKGYVFIFQNALNALLGVNYGNQIWKRKLEEAESYSAWIEAAQELDR